MVSLVALSGAVALGTVLAPDPWPGFVIPPYWQQVEGDKAILRFKTRQPVPVKITVDPAAEVTGDLAATPGLRHLELSGLEPGQRYTVRIEPQAVDTTASVVTATVRPVPEATETLQVLVLGDSRRYADRARSVARAASQERFDLILHTGDLVNYPGDRSLFATAFFGPLAPLLMQAEVVPAMGNHEDAAEEFHDFFELPGNERWFRMVRGPAEIIVVATDEWLDDGSPQLTWLDEVLGRPLREFRILMLHRPVVTWAGQWGPHEPAASVLLPRLRRAGVRLVLAGHSHLYERNLKLTEPEILYVTAGHAGSDWHSGQRERPPDVVGRTIFETLGFVTVQLSDNGAVMESKDTAGAVLDRCRFERTRWNCEPND